MLDEYAGAGLCGYIAAYCAIESKEIYDFESVDHAKTFISSLTNQILQRPPTEGDAKGLPEPGDEDVVTLRAKLQNIKIEQGSRGPTTKKDYWLSRQDLTIILHAMQAKHFALWSWVPKIEKYTLVCYTMGTERIVSYKRTLSLEAYNQMSANYVHITFKDSHYAPVRNYASSIGYEEVADSTPSSSTRPYIQLLQDEPQRRQSTATTEAGTPPSDPLSDVSTQASR